MRWVCKNVCTTIIVPLRFCPQPRLAHEAGAGAPCMNCNSACPGLDLHFWRKICKSCKCGRDDHDVDDDEFPQFNLLFGPSAKFKKKSMRQYTISILCANGREVPSGIFPQSKLTPARSVGMDRCDRKVALVC